MLESCGCGLYTSAAYTQVLTVFSFIETLFCLNYFEALFVFSICVDVLPQKSENLPHQVVAPILKYLFEAVTIIFLIKKCVLLTEYVIQC